jgi:hypothetical protein
MKLINLILEGNAVYPPGYKAAREVPYGGANCANCIKWNADKGECEGKYFIEYNGSGVIPTEPEKYLCNWWTQTKS